MPEKQDLGLKVSFGLDDTRDFATLQQLIEWVEPEIAAWATFRKSLDSAMPQMRGSANGALDRLAAACNYARQAMPLAVSEDRNKRGEYESLINQIRSELAQYSKFCTVSAGSARGQFVLSLAETDINHACAVLGAWSPRSVPTRGAVHWAMNQHDDGAPDPMRVWARGIITADLYERGMVETVKVERDALDHLRHKWDQRIVELTLTRQTADREMDARLNQLTDVAEKYRSTARRLVGMGRRAFRRGLKFYRNDLALKVPVTYWSAKADEHRHQAAVWGGIFVAMIVGMLIAFGFAYTSLIEELRRLGAAGAGASASLLAIFGIPAFLVIWALRIVARMLQSNVSQWHDAQERAVMTQTYLALFEEGKATKEDRILILHSLFRPSGATGSVDDNAPPHWFDLLMDRMKTK